MALWQEQGFVKRYARVWQEDDFSVKRHPRLMQPAPDYDKQAPCQQQWAKGTEEFHT